MAQVATCLFLILLVAVLSPAILLILWKWFVVPLGLPPIGYIHAAALMALRRFLFPPTSEEIHALERIMEDAQQIRDYMASILLPPSVAIILGALLHIMMVKS